MTSFPRAHPSQQKNSPDTPGRISLTMAHYLEGLGLVMIGLAQHGIGNFDFALNVTAPN